MLFCISVGKWGSGPGGRWFQSRQNIIGSCTLVNILVYRVSSLCRHSALPIYDSEAYRVLWHRESNALASMSVFLRTCHCCARILGSLSVWQSSPCLDKARQLLHSPQSSPGKLWNFRAEKANPKLWSPCPSKKKPNRFNLKLPTNLSHFLTPENSEIIQPREQLFVFVNDIWPKVNAYVLGPCT